MKNLSKRRAGAKITGGTPVVPTIKEFIQRALGVPFVDRGRDFGGWDCWGLVWQAYQSLGLLLPCLEEVPALKNWQARGLYEDLHRGHREVSPGQERPGDVAVFRGRPVHVGLVAARGLMLHVEPGLATVIEAFRLPPWDKRLMGVYRHVELASV